MLGIGLTRTRLSTRLGLSIGERLATLANTLADANLPLSAIPGLLDRVNAIVGRMTALGIAATDQNVAAAITAALANIGTQIDAIDLHQTWAVVLPLLEGYVTQLEDAADNSPAPTITNTLGNSPLLGTQVGGFSSRADSLDARILALGA